MRDVDDRDRALRVFDTVNDSIGAAPCAVTIRERRVESLADSVGILEQSTDDELVGRKGCRLGQLLGQLTPGGGGYDERVAISTLRHAVCLRRSFIARPN